MLPMLISAMLVSTTPESALHARWRACTEKVGDNSALDACGGAYIKAADAQLNATWRRLMAAVGSEPQTRTAMLTEQRAWLAYRNTACAFYGVQTDWGRAGEVLDGPECIGGVLERRTVELGAFARFVGPEGQGSR